MDSIASWCDRSVQTELQHFFFTYWVHGKLATGSHSRKSALKFISVPRTLCFSLKMRWAPQNTKDLPAGGENVLGCVFPQLFCLTCMFLFLFSLHKVFEAREWPVLERITGFPEISRVMISQELYSCNVNHVASDAARLRFAITTKDLVLYFVVHPCIQSYSNIFLFFLPHHASYKGFWGNSLQSRTVIGQFNAFHTFDVVSKL